MNSITLIGRAGRDPEVRYLESGSVVANLTLAVNRRSRDEEPDWFNLEIWGKQAQVAADYVRKGSLLGIIGSFKLDRWTDRSTGEERSKPVIRVDRLELLGSKRDGEGDAAPQADPPAAAPRPRATAPAAPPAWDGSGGVSADDIIPF
jgi:single-strand DNA-binding protein